MDERREHTQHDTTSTDAITTDPPLLRENSDIKSFSTSRYTYPAIRVFWHRHQNDQQLPKDPAPLPLFVFIHGLGGSVAQFEPLISRLIQTASCLAIDLPGCGRSQFAPRDWDAYSTEALVLLLVEVIGRHLNPNQGIVLIGHSMGCALAVRIAEGTLRSELDRRVVGLIAICPPAEPPKEELKKLLWVPGWIFDLWRAWDRRGGTESPSVLRFVGEGADQRTKVLQHRFNCQSRTPVFRRMAWGGFPKLMSGRLEGGIPGKAVWEGLDMPVCLIGGESDTVTPSTEVEKIYKWLGSGDSDTAVSSSIATPAILEEDGNRDHSQDRAPLSSLGEASPQADDAPPSPTGGPEKVEIPPQPLSPKKYVEARILDTPANHALLYAPKTVELVYAIISKFLAAHVTGRLDPGWQLRYLSKGGKWDVKNLEKWQGVEPVSDPIAGLFRAMKTLRGVDETHTPKRFVKNWGHEIKDVIDISHDEPVYNPQEFRDGGIQYYKFPTVSKTAPTDAEVAKFIEIVEEVREGRKGRPEAEDGIIGVHCHYGFNRTGYFIVCYLVDRCGYTLEDAIAEFATKRPNGIRHSHFLGELELRYTRVTALSDNRNGFGKGSKDRA